MTPIDKTALRALADKLIAENGPHWWIQQDFRPVRSLLNATVDDAKFVEFVSPTNVAALLDELATLTAENQQLRDLNTSLDAGWLDIESAPRDGTLIVLGARNGVWLGKYLPVYVSGFRPENPWSSMMLNHDHMAERYTRPTHWKPLPQSPTMGAEAAARAKS